MAVDLTKDDRRILRLVKQERGLQAKWRSLQNKGISVMPKGLQAKFEANQKELHPLIYNRRGDFRQDKLHLLKRGRLGNMVFNI